MKQFFMKFLKYFLLAATAILFVLVVFGVVLWLDWPLWMGIFLLLALIALGIGLLFLRKILLRRREQQFVQQVIEQDESRLKSLPEREQGEEKELQEQWKEAIEALRRSHLRKRGNPLYVLPWYLVIGESGSGKTTAIASARLPSSFGEAHRTSGISGTRNCDWWFFEQAVIIDTAGRYAIPVDQGKDSKEWQKFLGLLVKYRKKEPIHGLIVTVAADKLLASPEAMEEDGRNIRRRIDELMRVLGAKFPVYVLVTKCDLVQGMTQFCDYLPEKCLGQPMGVVGEDRSVAPESFLERAMRTVGDRLRNLRLVLAHREGAKAPPAGLLLFPEEFDGLKGGLDGFLRGAFHENPYQETPALRGLFFSSGRQEGSPYSHFLNALGLTGERDVLPGTNRGLFLHDFFATVLPRDRGRFAPTKRAIQWRSITRNLGLTAWAFLWLSLCGLLTFSFVLNLRAIREASHDYETVPALQGDFPADLAAMDRFGQAVLDLEGRNRNWWIPRFALNESLAAETQLKKKYCSQFQRNFLVPYDRQLGGNVEILPATVPDEILGIYVTHLVRRINLLNGRRDDPGLGNLRARPQPSYAPFLPGEDAESRQKAGDQFGRLYLHYLLWQPDDSELKSQAERLQTWLARILALKTGPPRWLIAWVDGRGDIPPVTLKEFWGGEEKVPEEMSISPSFTRKGKEEIDLFLKEIESAYPDPQEHARRLAAFEKWYRDASFQAWHAFGADFSNGAKRLKSREEWRQIAGKISSDEGPYLSFMGRMAKDLQPLATEKELPPWLDAVYRFQLAKTEASSGGVVAKAAEGGKSLIDRIRTSVGGIGGEKAPPQVSAPGSYRSYENALAVIIPVVGSDNQAFQLASQAFAEDPAVGRSPFYAARDAQVQVKASLGAGTDPDGMFGNLLAGPVDFLWAYARIETACSLQSQWDAMMADLQGSGGGLAQSVLNPEGPFWKFVKGPAAPFLGWNAQGGYFPREVLGGTIPFEPSFFSFLRQTAEARAVAMKTNYGISIAGLPTDANPDARQKPQSTHLELQCSTGVQSLDNFNYRVSRTFQWSLESCNDVTFRIQFVGGLTVEKRYPGNQAFLAFLSDFPGGQRTFSPEDFPESEADLKAMGIRNVRVRYEFGGDLAALRKIAALSESMPKDIATCWAQ